MTEWGKTQEEPTWVHETTSEWDPREHPGRRYPGDPGPRVVRPRPPRGGIYQSVSRGATATDAITPPRPTDDRADRLGRAVVGRASLRQIDPPPDSATQTDAPTRPIAPTAPAEPARPISPAVAEAPTRPISPAVAEAPTRPISPAVAEAPTRPISPAVAEAPTRPISPAVALASPAAPADEGKGWFDATVPNQRVPGNAPVSPAAVVAPRSPAPAATADTVLPAPESASGAATALSAPTMLTPVVTAADQSGTNAARSGKPTPDPERVLASYRWRFHPETLREIVDNPDELRTVRDGLTAKLADATGDAARARLLSLRAVVSRILGDLGSAVADGRQALAVAEATGELRRIAIASARLAHVLQWRGDFAEADRLFTLANSPELPDRLRATMYEHAGRSCYDQGRYIEACIHFERALDLRKVEDPDLIARTELALDAVTARVAENGWGPYPRSREETLQLRRPPVPAFDDRARRWGYTDADRATVIPPRYAEAQPFHEGLAWVRRPESRAWELIDEDGTTLIDAAAGYLSAGSFADGLAWVTRDGARGWFAIDRSNTVVVAGGFDDVRPFRRGVAAVCRGGWGAVDNTGRMVVPTRYDSFATALTDGRYVDGFTDEGLAVVDAAGRKGVVDRAGRQIVPPAHPALVIHPVAFLIGDARGRWGALDRRGAPLVDVVHSGRGAVIDEIDRLLADTHPVL